MSTANPPLDNSEVKFLSYQQLQDRRKIFNSKQVAIDSEEYVRMTIYDVISEIKDPEFQKTIEELDIIDPSSVTMKKMESGRYLVTIWWKPTVAHCSYATQIGLAMR